MLTMSLGWCLHIFSPTDLFAGGRRLGGDGGCHEEISSGWSRRPPVMHWIESMNQKSLENVTDEG
jgi:hypothetical protein